MNLKLFRILVISSIASITLSVTPIVYSEELHPDKELQASGFPVAQAVKADERVNALMDRLKNSSDPEHQKSVQISYNKDGYVEQIIDEGGVVLNVTYKKDKNDNISGVSVVMPDPDTAVEIDFLAQDRYTDSEGSVLAVHMVRGEREHRVIFKDPVLDGLLDTNAPGMLLKAAPLKITIETKCDLVPLLLSLKKSKASLADPAKPPIKISAMKEAVEEFKNEETIAVAVYAEKTEGYYAILRKFLSSKKDLSATPNAAPENEKTSSERAEIDESVARLLTEDQTNAVSRNDKRVRELQPRLSRMFIVSNQETLKLRLETSVTKLQEEIMGLFAQGNVVLIDKTDITTRVVICLQ